jgi:hypothetical protein
MFSGTTEAFRARGFWVRVSYLYHRPPLLPCPKHSIAVEVTVRRRRWCLHVSHAIHRTCRALSCRWLYTCNTRREPLGTPPPGLDPSPTCSCPSPLAPSSSTCLLLQGSLPPWHVTCCTRGGSESVSRWHAGLRPSRHSAHAIGASRPHGAKRDRS